jgi:hypothetical protein
MKFVVVPFILRSAPMPACGVVAHFIVFSSWFLEEILDVRLVVVRNRLPLHYTRNIQLICSNTCFTQSKSMWNACAFI